MEHAMISNAQKSLIHVAKSKTGMTDEEYRAMLSGFGVGSSTELDRARFDAVMRHFKKMGFRQKGGAKAVPAKDDPAASRDRMKRKIQAIADEMHLTRTYLDAISDRMFKINSWAWLDAEQLRKIVAVLTYHQRRKKETGNSEK
jgi:phage gp16-like protein